MIDAGLTPYQAIKTATVNAAEFLGKKGEVSTIAVGQQADLILLNTNPLEDTANINKRVGVMVRGHWLSEDELQEMMEDLSESYENWYWHLQSLYLRLRYMLR